MKIRSFLSAAALSVLLAVFSPSPAAQAQTSSHAPFFTGEVSVGGGFYYLQFPNSTNYLGYYTYFNDPAYLYHADAGYFYVIDAADGKNGVYLYDFKTTHFFYTSPTFPFPYLYDFSLKTFLYYFPDTNKPGHYTTNPRYFYVFGLNQIIQS